MLVAALLIALAPLPSAQIHKCRLPNGVLSFQAEPCARGTHLKTIVVPTNPAPAAPAASISATPAAPTAAATSVPPVTPPPAQPALPPAPYYRCSRPDGSSYYSASPLPRRQQVPVAQVSDPLVAATAGPDGQVWLEDKCAEVPLSEACEFYAQQIEFVTAQQRTVNGLALKRLLREQQRLATIRGARCRG